ncbi:MAG: hypothetical protein AB2693_32225 [Candidatus Thiodiazotropha sp.]
MSDNNVYEESCVSDDSDNDFTLVRKRQRRNTSGRSNIAPLAAFPNRVPDFDKLSVDEKLSTIFSTLTCNQDKVMQLERKMNTIIKMTQRMECIETVVNSYDDRLKLLEYKSIDNEARARRNNLLFKGIPESRDENCKRIICNFLEEKLGCDELPCIERAHRLGARRDPRRAPRPIIVAFSFYRDTENIMSSASALRDSPFGISRDYPVEINRARQTLWPQFKAARANNPRGQTSIGYPAKLIVNGRVTCDMFPDWGPILKGSRLDYSVKEPNVQSTITPAQVFGPQTASEASILNPTSNLCTPYGANAAGNTADSIPEYMEAQNYQHDQHINDKMDTTISIDTGTVVLPECSNRGAESANIAEQQKLNSQNDAIPEIEQSVSPPDTAQNWSTRKLPDDKDSDSDSTVQSSAKPAATDKCPHGKPSQTELCMSPGSLADSLLRQLSPVRENKNISKSVGTTADNAKSQTSPQGDSNRQSRSSSRSRNVNSASSLFGRNSESDKNLNKQK